MVCTNGTVNDEKMELNIFEISLEYPIHTPEASFLSPNLGFLPSSSFFALYNQVDSVHFVTQHQALLIAIELEFRQSVSSSFCFCLSCMYQ